MSTLDRALLLRGVALGVAILLAVSAGWFASYGASAAQPGDVSCDGNVDSIDAALVLQFSAGLIDSLPCPAKADPSGNGTTDAVDASLILQFAAGLLDHLGPAPSPPEPTPDATPPGAWSGTSYAGTTATGGEVRFVLSADGSAILSFIAEWGFCAGRFIGGLPVTGSFFSYDGWPFFSFTGVLEPPDSASGTVSVHSCDEDVPWSATIE